MKGFFIFAAGVVAGAVAGAYLVKDKVMADAKQEIEEVREYYKSKKHEDKEEQPVEEEPKVEEKEEYQEITRNYTNYNACSEQEEKPRPHFEEPPFIINPEDYGEDPDYPMETLTYFADGVLVDEVDEVIEDVDLVVGLENLKVFDEYQGATTIYVRCPLYKIDYEIIKDDWNWSDLNQKPEKKPHQL